MMCVCFQAEDVRRVADNELGFQQVTLSRPTQAKTYLFINTDRMVVGCLVAEPIRQVGLGKCVVMLACVRGRFSRILFLLLLVFVHQDLMSPFLIFLQHGLLKQAMSTGCD